MSRRLVVALDQGGSSSRALVFDEALQVVARAQVEVPTTRRGEDEVEQDGVELVQSLRRCIKDIGKQLGSRVNEVVAAGLATQRSSCVAWDRASGGALSPVLSWQDRRAAARVVDLAPHAERIRALTGLPLSPHYGASKLAWITNTNLRARTHMAEGSLALGPVASFLLARLCNEHPCVVDLANALRTQLVSLETLAWDPWLCDSFGVPRTALPTIVATRAAFGTLDLGKRTAPLTVCTGDQSAALWAAGAPQTTEATVVFGTGAFVQRVVHARPAQADGLLVGIVAKDDSSAPVWAVEGTVNGAGSALAWALEELELGEQAFDLDALLRSETAPPLFLNGVAGLGSPWWRSDFASHWLSEGTPQQKLVAVVESIVYMVCENLERLRQIEPLQTLRVGGGLATLDGVCQRLADVSGLQVVRSSEKESTARGLARQLLQSVTARSETAQVYTPRNDPALLDRWQRWREAMRAATR